MSSPMTVRTKPCDPLGVVRASVGESTNVVRLQIRPAFNGAKWRFPATALAESFCAFQYIDADSIAPISDSLLPLNRTPCGYR
jgi:hypothetical protein